MSSRIVDLRDLHNAYTRLTEKFKTFWTFHQFLQGLHKTFFSDAPGYQIDFQSLYDQIKGVTNVMTFQPPPVVLDLINQLDSRLDQVHRSLAADDAKIAPSHVRRFFERVRTEDEKLILALLRFYFYSRQATNDELDKMDFLLTLVGARRSLDDGRYLTRFPQELQKLFGQLLSLVKRNPVARSESTSLVRALGLLRIDIETCERFEDLTEKKILENLRTLKHRLGPAYYDADVLSAVLDANLAAKNRFQSLYREEEKRIAESSQQLVEIERELARNPETADTSLQEEFRKYRVAKEDFERQKSEGEVRHQQVTRLAESIDQLLARLELPATAVPFEEQPEEAVGAEAEEAESGASTETLPGVMVGNLLSAHGAARRAAEQETAETPAPAAAFVVNQVPATNDPLTGEQAAKLLYSIEAVDEGTGSGQAAYAGTLSRLRLEPWEVRAARRIIADELPTQADGRTRDVLFFDAAALRLRIDEDAQRLKRPATEGPSMTPDELTECGRVLARAQEVDRRFRQAIEQAASSAPPERLNELNRSRFRLLRSFSGLWLLHNSRVAGA